MSDFAIVVSPTMRCPECGSTATIQASSASGACDVETPEPGDLVVCIGCEAIAVLTSGLQLRPFTADDCEHYALDDVARVVRAVNELRASFERKN